MESTLRASGSAITSSVAASILGVALLVACSRDASAPSGGDDGRDTRAGSVTVTGDDRIAKSLTWHLPEVTLPPEGRAAVTKRAAAALAAGRLYADGDSAIPLYMALLKQAPGDSQAQVGLQQSLEALLASGNAVLDTADDDIEALRDAHQVAAVARTVAPDDKAVQEFLHRVDLADQLWELNRQAEQDLRAGRLGESGGGALAKLHAVLHLRPLQARALQGLAAVESGLIRRAEDAGQRDDFAMAEHWIVLAAKVRPGSTTIPDARARLVAIRGARVAQLHDEGMRALLQRTLLQSKGIAVAHRKLAEILLIAEPGDPVAAELRERIDLVTHYGLFHPGQGFTEALKFGARGPEMVVVPHGGFRMGARDGDDEGGDDEKPVRYVRFDRGFAMSRTETTVDEFRQFVRASGYQPTATHRGRSLVYEERNGNFVLRTDADWQSAYDGSRAGDDLPVVHVSARDAEAYAAWLAKQSGALYRLPSEAEFEYALRAGGKGRLPWGDDRPPVGAGNLTGAKDRSPSDRHWANGFSGYGDGFWGPAPVARFQPNAYGLHDLAGNVSEWVADCWHDGYRRAPDDGEAWLNPGCQMGVVRGGSWASSPAQTRSAWRAPVRVDATNARIGFRVVRDL
jgi:formylglycine-generating enzyme required for sulfatase activity